MFFNIDPRSSTPVYQQLIDAIKGAVARGIYSPGDKIPTVREMAALLTINPNTTAKAYQKLEQEGVIVTMRSRGTFIAERQEPAGTEEIKKILKPSLDRLRVDAYHLGMGLDELKVLFIEILDEWEKDRRDV